MAVSPEASDEHQANSENHLQPADQSAVRGRKMTRRTIGYLTAGQWNSGSLRDLSAAAHPSEIYQCNKPQRQLLLCRPVNDPGVRACRVLCRSDMTWSIYWLNQDVNAQASCMAKPSAQAQPFWCRTENMLRRFRTPVQLNPRTADSTSASNAALGHLQASRRKYRPTPRPD